MRLQCDFARFAESVRHLHRFRVWRSHSSSSRRRSINRNRLRKRLFVQLLLVGVNELQTLRMDGENVGQKNGNELTTGNHREVKELDAGRHRGILRFEVLSFAILAAEVAVSTPSTLFRAVVDF